MTPAPAEADITPVLVTYNSAGILDWSLPMLQACPQVVVVDNHSADDTVATVQRLLPQATVLQAGRNLGFGRANNLGLAQVATRYALLLNPDGRLQPGALQALHAAAARYPEAAILAPVLYDAPEVVGDFFRGPFWQPASRPPPLPAGDLCCDFVTGAAMLLDLHKMRGVGFFDPWFFLYCEDDDLCLRTRQAGHAVVVVGDAAIEHRTRQSSAPSARNTFRRSFAMTLSRFYLLRKFRGLAPCVQAVLRIGLGSALSLPLQLLLGRRENALKQAARLWAALRAPVHLRRAHCFEPAR